MEHVKLSTNLKAFLTNVPKVTINIYGVIIYEFDFDKVYCVSNVDSNVKRLLDMTRKDVFNRIEYYDFWFSYKIGGNSVRYV